MYLQGVHAERPITLHISFCKRRRLSSEGQANLTGITGRELRSTSTTRQNIINTLPHPQVQTKRKVWCTTRATKFIQRIWLRRLMGSHPTNLITNQSEAIMH